MTLLRNGDHVDGQDFSWYQGNNQCSLQKPCLRCRRSEFWLKTWARTPICRGHRAYVKYENPQEHGALLPIFVKAKHRKPIAPRTQSIRVLMRQSCGLNRLERLPYDVRDLIWRELLGDRIIPLAFYPDPKSSGKYRLTIQRSELSSLDPEVFISYRRCEGLDLAVLRTCRSLYFETIQTLYATNRFHIECHANTGGRSAIRPCLIENLPYCFAPQHFQMIRNMHIRICASDSPYFWAPQTFYQVSMHQASFRRFSELISPETNLVVEGGGWSWDYCGWTKKDAEGELDDTRCRFENTLFSAFEDCGAKSVTFLFRWDAPSHEPMTEGGNSFQKRPSCKVERRTSEAPPIDVFMDEDGEIRFKVGENTVVDWQRIAKVMKQLTIRARLFESQLYALRDKNWSTRRLKIVKYKEPGQLPLHLQHLIEVDFPQPEARSRSPALNDPSGFLNHGGILTTN